MLAIFVAAALGASGVIPAEDRVAFTFSRAELSSTSGIAALHERLSAVAVKACEESVATGLKNRTTLKRCAADIADQFVDAIGDERLAAVHDGEKRYALAR